MDFIVARRHTKRILAFVGEGRRTRELAEQKGRVLELQDAIKSNRREREGMKNERMLERISAPSISYSYAHCDISVCLIFPAVISSLHEELQFIYFTFFSQGTSPRHTSE